MHFCTGSKDIQVGNVEDVEFCHDWLGVCSWWCVFDESDDFLLGSDEGLQVAAFFVVRSPYRDSIDQMWVYVGKVELFHYGGWQQFVGISEGLDEWLQLLDDGGDVL